MILDNSTDDKKIINWFKNETPENIKFNILRNVINQILLGSIRSKQLTKRQFQPTRVFFQARSWGIR
jgi:hypothetical protein